jgi:hypothetical protein
LQCGQANPTKESTVSFKISPITVLIVLMMTAWIAAPAYAGEPRYTHAVLSDSADGEEYDEFATDTDTIVMRAKVKDVAPGTRLASAWIAENIKGLSADQHVLDLEVVTKNDTGHVEFTASKPTAGWPVGHYRVALSINGEVSKVLRFEVTK